VAYVGALNGVTWLADRSDAQVTLPAEAIFNENAQEPEPAMRAAAERALALYALASPPPDGWSVLPFGWRQVDLRRAYLLCAVRDLAGAERLMRRSWERDGPDESVAAVLARILRSMPSRRAEAIAWYDEALRAEPAWQRLREEQVTWLDQEGEHARMVQSARDGLAARPGDLLAMRRLSLALVERGADDAEVEEGIALVRRTLEIAPGNGFAHAALARGLARLGRWDESAAEFRRAQELEPASELIQSMAEEAEAQRDMQAIPPMLAPPPAAEGMQPPRSPAPAP
jgi:tetratricopeptide (TPR) repeat protein